MYEDAHQETEAQRDMTGPGPDELEASPLRPCPFCGQAAVPPHRYLTAWVRCGSCGAEGPVSTDGAEAIDAWNRRAPVRPMDGSPAGDEIAVLRITLSKLRDAADVHEWIEKSERMGWGLAEALNDAAEILDAADGEVQR